MTIIKKIIKLDFEGKKIYLHCWVPSKIIGSVFYLHGLQSHASWSWELGRYLATRGVAVFILDRVGSGISEGLRGDYSSIEEIYLAYQKAYSLAKKYTGEHVSFIIFGHCLGGRLLMGIISAFPSAFGNSDICICSSWLGKTENNLDFKKIDSLDLAAVNLDPYKFSDINRYIDFINNDPLSVREITLRSKIFFAGLEKNYLMNTIEKKSSSFFYIVSKYDSVIDVNNSILCFKYITKGRGKVVIIDEKAHFIPYTKSSYKLYDFLLSNFLNGEKL